MTTERITAGKVAGVIDDHLAQHRDLYNPRAERMNVVLFGKDGNDGLVTDVRDLDHCYNDIDKRLTSIEGYIKWLILLVMGAIIGAGLNLIIK